ncbi:MAG: hypothetical protein WBD38_03905 [Candidatus Dormiibacterota bacterium]
MARLTTAVVVFGVMSLSAAPALAADPITYYQGAANGQALSISANPNSVVNLNLGLLTTELNTILQTAGLGGTVITGILSDLNNPLSPLAVSLDGATSQGKAAAGQALTGGTASTTPVSIDDAALSTELALLKTALNKIPKALLDQLTPLLTAALNQVMSNLVAKLAALNLPLLTGGQVTTISNDITAIGTAITNLGSSIADTLGNPSANILNSYSVNFPDEINNSNVTAKGGIVTSGPFNLSDFTARAMPSDATGSNTVSSLNLIPTGAISLVNLPAGLSALATLISTLDSDVNGILTNTLSGLGLGSVGTVLGGTITTITGQANALLATVITTLNSAYNTLVAAINGVLTGLTGLGLGTLSLNDLLSTGPSTALATVLRKSDGTVQANAIGDLANVKVLQLTNVNLLSVLKAIPGIGSLGLSLDKALLTLDAVHGTSNVTLDGTNPSKQSATGTIADISILGQSLKALSGLNIDAILPPGTTCVISIPGGVSGTACAIPAVLPALPGTPLDGLITITLARGATVNSTGPIKNGTAGIVTLEVSANVDCSKVPGLSNLGILGALTLCGSPPAAAGARAAAAPRAATGNMQLLDIQLGVANSAASLEPSTLGASCTQNCNPVQVPNTGSSEWLLGIIAALLVLAGAGIQVFRTRPEKA